LIRREKGGVQIRGSTIHFGTEVRQRNSRRWLWKFSGVLVTAPAGHPMLIGRVQENWWKYHQIGFRISPFDRKNYGYDAARRSAPAGRFWWYYGGVVYVTDDGSLHSGHIKALLDERENRNQLKLQKAQGLQGEAKPSSRRASQTIADKIRQLGELRDQGLLTQAEFDSKKADLLRRM